MAVYRKVSEVSDRLCACGCGEFTMVATKTQASKGVVKGEPRRFVVGHARRGTAKPKPPKVPRPVKLLPLCACGCGERVRSRRAKVLAGHFVPRPVVREGIYRVEANGCWTWLGRFDIRGYGRLKRDARDLIAHRAVYEELVGPVADGLSLHHVCENKACVNPDHLVPLTPREHGLLHEYVLRDAA